MSDVELQSDGGFSSEDQAEIQRLAERSKAMSRRSFVAASGGLLAFALPAIATFTISPDALGSTGSGRGQGGGRDRRPHHGSDGRRNPRPGRGNGRWSNNNRRPRWRG